MNKDSSRPVSDHLDRDVVRHHPHELHVRFRVRRLARLFIAVTIVFTLVSSLFIGAVYFLISGTAGKQSVIQSSLEATLQDIVGPNYQIALGKTNIQFELPSLLSVSSSSVRILRMDNQNLVAEIEEIRFGARLWQTILGNPSFDSVTIGMGKLNVGELVNASGIGFPSHIKPALTQFGQQLKRLSLFSADGRFQSMKMSDFLIVSPLKQDDAARQIQPILIKKLELSAGSSGAFNLDGVLESGKSRIVLSANYENETAELAKLNVQGEGIDLEDWLPSPDSNIGAFGSNGTIGWNASFPFNSDGSPQQPIISIHSNEHDLRIGKEISQVQEFAVNFRLIPEKNQIELDRSPLSVGKLRALFIGGLRPADIKIGYAGPVEFEVIAERAFMKDIRSDEQSIPAAFSARGFWFPGSARMELSQAFMATNDGRIDGKGRFEFSKTSVAISGEASSTGVSAVAVKQFWPFFLGGKAREWAHRHVIGGWIENAKLVAAIPAGIIGNIQHCARMKPEHFQMAVEFKEASFQPFGELPPVFDAAGAITISGMQVDIMLDGGKITGEKFGDAQLDSAKLAIADFADRPALAEAEFSLDGKASVLASIAQSEPLRVMSRLKSSAAEIRGSVHVDIVAKFPLLQKVKENQVEWNALIDLKNGSVSRKLSGRKITKANVLIDANSEVAWVSGTASIDGVKAKLDIVEPLGKKSSYKKSRKFVATLDAKIRKKIGLNLEPVIAGPMILTVEQVAGKKEIQHLDLTQAEINLPWVGWQKGAGVPARATYSLSSKSKVNRFENIVISGTGFGAKGDLVFDKKGLRSAKMKKFALNESDDFDLVIGRKGGVYNIDVKGRSYDARGMINKLIHDGDFDSAQEGRSVNVTIQMDRLIGFNERGIDNASIRYIASNGRIDHLSIAGSAASGKPFQVLASRAGKQTEFEFVAEDAGHALAFMNIYSRMQSGRLAANLRKSGNGPYRGAVNVRNFVLVDEPRLKQLVNASETNSGLRNGEDTARRLKKVTTNRAKFSLVRARIEKGDNYLLASDGLMRGSQVGFTFDGTIYDRNDRTNLKGTFMPAYGISRVVSAIPIIGEIFSNGRDGAFIGITYRLKGKMDNPDIEINPLSLAAPGIFNKIFEFKD